jgi:membrane-associated phospholipid phosphatase
MVGFLIVGSGIVEPVQAQDERPVAGIFGPSQIELPLHDRRDEWRVPPEVAAVEPQGGQPAQKPPAPEHTGLAAIAYKTAADFKGFPQRRSTRVILGIGGAAAALAHPADDEVNGRLVGSRVVGRFFTPGKWIGSTWVQGGTAIGLYVIGRYVLPHTEGESKTNRVSHLGFDLLRAALLSQALTQGIKVAVRRDRPTGECCAFPSGHASTTFATASVLERHLGYRAAWPTLVIATYVGASRLHDNRHFLSDVLFGASVGMASGWTVVGRHGRSDYSLMPVPIHGGVMIALARVPHQATP